MRECVFVYVVKAQPFQIGILGSGNTTHTRTRSNSVYGAMQKDVEHRHDCVFAFVFGGGLSLQYKNTFDPSTTPTAMTTNFILGIKIQIQMRRICFVGV